MLTINDVVFQSHGATPADVSKYTTLLLGIDGAVQHIWGTYDNVADLVQAGYTKRDVTADYDDGTFYIEYADNGAVVETIQVTEIIWALIMSDCDIIEIVRDATVRATPEEVGPIFYVETGWPYTKVGDSYEVTPPSGWAPPSPPTLDQKYASVSGMVEKIEEYLEKNPGMTQGYADTLNTARTKQAELLAQIEERDGQQ